MFIKAYAKTRGAARLYPIFAPINMGHVNADGFFASCVARYTQVRGPGRGEDGEWGPKELQRWHVLRSRPWCVCARFSEAGNARGGVSRARRWRLMAGDGCGRVAGRPVTRVTSVLDGVGVEILPAAVVQLVLTGRPARGQQGRGKEAARRRHRGSRVACSSAKGGGSVLGGCSKAMF
jgi:hypothetical protein